MKRIIPILVLVFFVFPGCFNAQACKHKVILNANKPFTEQVNEPNTVYIISSEFDLGGKEVSIPESCTLKFKGGLIKNGKLIGNNTDIDSPRKKIMDASLSVDGTWKVREAFSEWFGPKADGSDDTAPLIAFFNFPAPKKTLKEGEYYTNEMHCEGLMNSEIYAYGATLRYQRTHLDCNEGEDHVVLANYNGEILYDEAMKGWLHIYGLTIDGNSNNLIYNPKPEKFTDIINHHTMRLVLIDELLLKDCTFKNSFMTAVMLDVCKKSQIVNCNVINSGESIKYKPDGFWYTWEGISVMDKIYTFDKGWQYIQCDECIVRDSYFENIGGSFASANCKTFKCYNNKVVDNRGYAFELSSKYDDRLVNIHHNEFYGVGASAIDMTYFELPNDGVNTVLIHDNKYYDLGYDSHRTLSCSKAFLMVYRNKEQNSHAILDVQVKNNLFELSEYASQALVRSDKFLFEGNTCRGYSGEQHSALFFCGDDENIGSYIIRNNTLEMNSGAVSIIRSPKSLEVINNTITTSISPAIVYIQGDVKNSTFKVNNNHVNGVRSLLLVSSPANNVEIKNNTSQTIDNAIIRTSSDLIFKCIFKDNSFVNISGQMRNVEVVE